MKVTISEAKNSWLLLIPISAGALVILIGVKEASKSSLFAAGCGVLVLIVGYLLWRNVFNALSIESSSVIVERNGSTADVALAEVSRASVLVWRFSYTVALVIWLRTRWFPVIAWSGFLRSNIGDFTETVEWIKSNLIRPT